MEDKPRRKYSLLFGPFIILVIFWYHWSGKPIPPGSMSDYTKSFIAVHHPKVALINAILIDGTGAPAKRAQTVLIEYDFITEVNHSDSITIPVGFKIIDLDGKTLIPGIIGTHNHMRLPQGAMLSTSPKLYLAGGVTTLQTCGTGNPYEELAIAKSIEQGQQPGPEIINSGPYLTGPSGKSNFIRFTDEKMIRDTIRYWTKLGVKWFKVYRHTRPQDLRIILDEAHKHQAKVTGHLCATTYTEAAELGIDAIEHGFLHSYDHAQNREPDSCSGSTNFRMDLEIHHESVRQVQQKMISRGVALGSTLAIFATQASAQADPRDLEVMAPFHQQAYHHRLQRKKELGTDWYFKDEWLKKSMQYDLQFYRQGGLLVAGPDPGLHNLPGYGDQKNYELFIAAGFKPEEAIQVMTSNGARLLDRPDIGVVTKGKKANLVVLQGDLTRGAKTIRNVEVVFKSGIGYDPKKLVEAVKGNVGSATDDLMTYFGQKEPEFIPEKFAPDQISKSNRHEFGSIFSKTGREFFFAVDNGRHGEIYFSRLQTGVWSRPEKLFDNVKFSSNDPMFSPQEDRLYFISDRPLDSSGHRSDINIWSVSRNGDGWSAPVPSGSEINSDADEYYPCFSQEGVMYFASNRKSRQNGDSNFDIYRSAMSDGIYTTPEKLSMNINSDGYEADVFVAPDETYLIYCSIRDEGFGQGDLYISFKDTHDQWGPSRNMGNVINSSHHELCPFVTNDGKFLFFTRDKDIFWVSAGILDNYRDPDK